MNSFEPKKTGLVFLFSAFLSLFLGIRAESVPPSKSAAPAGIEQADWDYVVHLSSSWNGEKQQELKAQWHNPAFAQKKGALVAFVQSNWQNISGPVITFALNLDAAYCFPVFMALAKTHFLTTRPSVLAALERYKPEVRQEFTAIAAECAPQLFQPMQTSVGLRYGIIDSANVQKYNEEALKAEAKKFAESLSAIDDTNLSFITLLVEHIDSSLAPLFMEIIKKDDVHFIFESSDDSITQVCKGTLCQALMKADSSSIDYFAEKVGNKIGKENIWLIPSIVEAKPALASHYAQIIVADYAAVAQIGSGFSGHVDCLQLFYGLMKADKTVIDLFVGLIGSDLRKEHLLLSSSIVRLDAGLAPHFVDLIIKNRKQLAASIQGDLSAQSNYGYFLQELLRADSSALGKFAIAVHFQEFCDALCCEKLIQSTNHFNKNKAVISPTLTIMLLVLSDMFEVPDFAFIKKCLEKERELANAGYVTFYHGQAVSKFIPIKLDTLLHSIRTGNKHDNFLFLHTKPDPVFAAMHDSAYAGLSPQEIQSKVFELERARREQLLGGSRHDHNDEDRSCYLFLNDSLCGNSTDPGSNSFPCYFCGNFNIGSFDHLIKNDTKTIFENHGFGQHAASFEAEIAHLQSEYLEVSKFGTLYLIGVPKDTVHLNVVSAVSGGFQQALKVDGQLTTDMQKIAQALVTDGYVEPTDAKEYVGIMTHDEQGWLNPASGIKVFPMIIPTSEEKLAAFNRKWQDFETRLRSQISPFQA